MYCYYLHLLFVGEKLVGDAQGLGRTRGRQNLGAADLDKEDPYRRMRRLEGGQLLYGLCQLYLPLYAVLTVSLYYWTMVWMYTRFIGTCNEGYLSPAANNNI